MRVNLPIKMSAHFCKTIFGIPSGPVALYGDNLAMCLWICSTVIQGGSGKGSGYSNISKLSGIGGGGGKNIFAKVLAFSSLLLINTSAPSWFLTLRVGILGLPPSPTGSLMNLLAVQMSAAVISSK